MVRKLYCPRCHFIIGFRDRFSLTGYTTCDHCKTSSPNEKVITWPCTPKAERLERANVQGAQKKQITQGV
jgi:hypothetical protein